MKIKEANPIPKILSPRLDMVALKSLFGFSSMRDLSKKPSIGVPSHWPSDSNLVPGRQTLHFFASLGSQNMQLSLVLHLLHENSDKKKPGLQATHTRLGEMNEFEQFESSGKSSSPTASYFDRSSEATKPWLQTRHFVFL